MKDFEEIDLEAVPQVQNEKVDALTVVASLFQPRPKLEKGSRIVMLYKPSIPNNRENW